MNAGNNFTKGLEKYIEGGYHIASPVFDSEGNLFLTSTQSGDIHRVVDGELQTVTNSGGVPNAIAFDSSGVLYVCDFAHQGILTVADDVAEFVKEYEGKLFKGPNSLIFDKSGTMYFTDSGPLGETSVQNPKGSVFSITADGQLLQPLAYECLAYPSGVALSPDDTILYVSETMNNRILRFIQKPAGVFHFTVFHQFSGGFGPTALACDNDGNLYVGRYDPVANREGIISVIAPNGKELGEIKIPGSDITGLSFDREKKVLYITEATNNAVYRIAI